MEVSHWISLGSALVFLFVAILAAANARRSPLAAPLGRMSAVLFAYDALEVLKILTGRDELFFVECAAASLVAPTTAALVIRFLGEWRRLRPLVIAGASYFSLLALLCLAALVVPELRSFPGSGRWALALLGGIVPEFGYLFYRLALHMRRSGAAERTRTQLLVLALVLGVGGAASDLVSIAGAETPRIASFGLIAAALVLTALSLRFELLERIETLAILYASTIGAVAFLSHVFLLATLGEQPTLLALLLVSVTLAAVATLRPLLALRSDARARTGYLVTLGRFSAQMAHDVKNPLAAIRGAAQFLREERAQGRSIDDQAAFVELIVEQTDRLERVISDYQRLGKAEAHRAPLALHTLVDEVAAAQRMASPSHRIETRVDGELTARLDRDLVLGALENLVRNAREATPGGGRVTVTARRDERGAVELAVEDDGPGMDARTREQAFDDFFTTKATGSGLGLAFVHRVAVAHAGSARIEAAEPRGTRVVLNLPDRDGPA